jgi:hypothetical protein
MREHDPQRYTPADSEQKEQALDTFIAAEAPDRVDDDGLNRKDRFKQLQGDTSWQPRS